MHIKQLNIINVRGFKNETLKFSPGINLLLGANNSGKSSILKCIHMLQFLQPPLTLDDVRKTRDTGLTLVETAGISDEDKVLFRISNESFRLSDPQQILFAIHRNRNGQEGNERLLINMQDARVELFEDDIRVLPLEITNRFINFNGFATSENENNFIYPFLARRKTQHYSSQGGKDNAFAVHYDFHNLPAKIENISNPSHPFNEDFIRHCKDILGFTLGKAPGNNANENRLGFFVDQNTTIFLESMGEGVANILGLLTILLTENHKLFLIEEIENDVHPAALKKLLSLILEKSANNQFIVSTHSNIVLKYLASAKGSKIFYTNASLESENRDAEFRFQLLL